METYYLALDNSPVVHQCRVVRGAWGKTHEREHWIVELTPPIESAIFGDRRAIKEAVIAFTSDAERETLRRGKMAWIDCALSEDPIWQEVIDEREFKKFSPGSVHVSHDEAAEVLRAM